MLGAAASQRHDEGERVVAAVVRAAGVPAAAADAGVTDAVDQMGGVARGVEDQVRPLSGPEGRDRAVLPRLRRCVPTGCTNVLR